MNLQPSTFRRPRIHITTQPEARSEVYPPPPSFPQRPPCSACPNYPSPSCTNFEASASSGFDPELASPCCPLQSASHPSSCSKYFLRAVQNSVSHHCALTWLNHPLRGPTFFRRLASSRSRTWKPAAVESSARTEVGSSRSTPDRNPTLVRIKPCCNNAAIAGSPCISLFTGGLRQLSLPQKLAFVSCQPERPASVQ